MKTSVMLAAGAFAVALSGCTQINEAMMPVAAKVNAAYPPPPEVQAARDRLLGLLAEDSKQMESVHAQLESRMALRALSCTQNISISRLSTVASVKKLGLDQSCFQAQDQAVQTFLGVRSVGALMAQPPLRPLKPAGLRSVLPRGALSYINFGIFARDAGVAVLRDNAGDAAVVELPSGAVITKLPRMMTNAWSSRMSPNGRVLVVQDSSQGSVTFFDSATGYRLWDAPGIQSLLSWLPEVGGFVLAERNGGTVLADGLTGALSPHPLAARNASFAATLPGSQTRTLIGTSHELVLMEHTRTASGLQASEVRRLRITSGSGITSGQPVPMQQGKLVVFTAHPNIGWLNLESGESGNFRTSPAFGATSAKLDESRLLVDSNDLQNPVQSNPWVFDITAQTVAPVDRAEMSGILIQTAERPGFMRRANEAWVADAVQPTAEPVPLDQVAGEYEVQLQLAKLKALAQMEAAQAAAATSSPSVSGQASNRAAGMAGPSLPGLPRDAQVHMVGVYEGHNLSTSRTGPRQPQSIRVILRPTGKPVVLALSSYESVRWVLVNNGANIAAVLVSGYEPSTVTGASNAPVLRSGSNYAYKAGSPEHMRWRQEIQQAVGPLDIRSFQGQYSGTEFLVGGGS
ncbi:MAG: hypothetical protein ABI605_18725 [Rhizobacter sp.]